ncbi:tenomodulin [Protopterus annectens]|uniref:tenomodulin n=1 Tax=Protopterus annectens TaxID=7888 RepID=UPI001CFB2EBE|nr:tenomodulin [Protopterus annectens]
MEKSNSDSTAQCLITDIEASKRRHKNYRQYAIIGLVLTFLAISLTFGIFGVLHFWNEKPGKVYDIEYKMMINGEVKKTLMEIDSANRLESFRTGNASDEVLEIHDFKNGITAITFAGQHKCYIKTQTKDIPQLTPAMLEATTEVDDEITTTHFEESVIWAAEQNPVKDRSFLENSLIFQLCRDVPIHWVYPSYVTEAERLAFEQEGKDNSMVSEAELPKEIKEVPKTKHKRQAEEEEEEYERYPRVHDYQENEAYFDTMLDHYGYCCTSCRHGHRHCRRVCEPLYGYMPWPYCYQGGRVICRIIMPCNWWVARMLGRI